MTEYSEKFFDKFKKDYLPSYDFFRLFFAKLAVKGITLVNYSDLKSFLHRMKGNTAYSKLLEDIRFYFNGVRYVSKDIEVNINTLQTLGAVGRSNPTYEILLNYLSSESSKRLLHEFADYNNELDLFVEEFITSTQRS